MKQLIKILALVCLLIGLFLGGWFLGRVELRYEPYLSFTKKNTKTEELKVDLIVKEAQNFFNEFTIIKEIEQDNIRLYLMGKNGSCGLYMGECYFFIKSGEENVEILKKLDFFPEDLKIKKLVVNDHYSRYFLEYTYNVGDGPAGGSEKNRMDMETGEVQLLSSQGCSPSIDDIIGCEKTIYFYNINTEKGFYEFIKKCNCFYSPEIPECSCK